jgi:5-methylcytosine-specific restriction protein A
VATFLLTWNPDTSGWPDDEYEAAAAGGAPADRWSVGIRKHGIAPGDRAFMLRQSRDRGLVASGYFASEIYEDHHWDGSARFTTYADVRLDVILPIADRLPTEVLKAEVPAVPWDRLQGSGVAVVPPHDGILEQVWAAHVDDALDELPNSTYEEGALARVLVNRYERDRTARAACIAYHGTTCLVCGFDFEERYGELGRDVIHVHHVREISTLGPGYRVDPRIDLIPLCANCHAMVHRARPALQPDDLRRLLRRPPA